MDTRKVLTDDVICLQYSPENTSGNDEDNEMDIMQDDIITKKEAKQCIDKLKCFVQRQSDSDQKTISFFKHFRGICFQSW